MTRTLIFSISFFIISFGIKGQSESIDLVTETQKLMKEKEWKKAEEKLTVLIKFFPNEAGLYFNRGYVREMDLRYEECIPDYTRAISLQPGMHIVRTNRGFAYQNLGQFGKAIADFTAELSVNPNAYSYEHRSFVYYLKKDYKKALVDVNKSIEKDSINSISFKTRAKIYKAINLKAKSCADKERALELELLIKYPKYENDILELNEYCGD